MRLDVQKPERASHANEISDTISALPSGTEAVRRIPHSALGARTTPGTSIATMASIARSLAAPAAKLTSRRISKQVCPRVPLPTRKTTSRPR